MALKTGARPTAPSEALAGTTPKKKSYARLIEQTWIWSVVGYSVLRLFIAWGAFGDYGANVWIFALVDVGTAWPYAKSVAVVCKRAANAEWTKLPLAVAVAIVLFFAPYAYLWFAAGEMPAGLRVGMAICVSVLLVAATTGIVVKTRKMRRAAANDEQVGDLTDQSPTELVIDLTGENARVERRTV